MNILIESMVKFTFKVAPWKEFTIRCWRQETDYKHDRSKQSQLESMAAVENIPKETVSGSMVHQYEIAKAILEVDRMNAVEVLDESGAGLVAYKDWP